MAGLLVYNIHSDMDQKDVDLSVADFSLPTTISKIIVVDITYFDRLPLEEKIPCRHGSLLGFPASLDLLCHTTLGLGGHIPNSKIHWDFLITAATSDDDNCGYAIQSYFEDMPQAHDMFLFW